MHVFVVGRQGSSVVAAIRGILHDWSAVGLVGPSVWIDPAGTGGNHSGVAVSAVRVEAGVIGRIDLRSWMPRNPGQVRVVCVQSLAEPDATVSIGDVFAFLQSVRLPPNTPMVNLLVPDEGTETASTDVVFDSQVNVLVQPVDAADPQAAIEPLATGSPTFAMHGAAALATAAGLWTGMAVGPLDAEPPWSGVGVAVGRAYLRRLDATPVLDRLADEVYGTPGRLPTTRTEFGEPMAVVAPVAQLAAAEAAAHAVLTKHQAVTRFHAPPPFTEPPRRKLGFGEALRMFLSFIGRAVVNAPQSWAREVIASAKGRVEQGATRFFFGDRSGYQVVLTGLSAAQTPDADQATMLQDAAVGLLSRMTPGGEPPPTRVPQLWDDTVRTVAALADGGEPDPAVPLPGEGGRQVIDNPARLCSAPGEPPFRVPHGLPGSESGPIQPNDPWHAMQVDRVLRAQAQDVERAGGHPGQVDRMATLAQIRHQLAGWVGQRRSAMWAISSGLAMELDRARAMQADLLAAAQGGDDPDLQAPLAGQRRVRRGVLAWLVVALLAVVVAVVLRVVDTVSTTVCITIIVAALLVCLIGAFLTFVRGQRALLHAIHQLNVAAHRREWLAANAVRVTQEMYRLAGIYRQSRAWSDVVSEYVNAPFGTPEATARQHVVPARLSGELPLAVTVATAAYSPHAHEPVVYQARARLLRKDWLITSIDVRRRLVIDRIRQQTGRDLENRLSSDADLLPGGPLLSFLEVLRQPAVQTQARNVALTRLVAGIRDSGVGDRLLPVVRVEAGAIRAEQSWDAMTRALVIPQGQLSYDGFGPSGITNRAPTIGRSLLATDAPVAAGAPLVLLPVSGTDGRHQLDRFIVRWDLTYPMTPEYLTYFGRPGTEPDLPTVGASIIDVQS